MHTTERSPLPSCCSYGNFVGSSSDGLKFQNASNSPPPSPGAAAPSVDSTMNGTMYTRAGTPVVDMTGTKSQAKQPSMYPIMEAVNNGIRFPVKVGFS
mmetsp:Transcript_8821/g.15917  ORF Transcript_8821/g.15917 Transcript_8821/m.15917 type:complete len:98 (-) Transcript_8821:128-421(-)